MQRLEAVQREVSAHDAKRLRGVLVALMTELAAAYQMINNTSKAPDTEERAHQQIDNQRPLC